MPRLEAGTVFVQVSPSFKGFQSAAAKVGIQGGETLAAAFEKAAASATINPDNLIGDSAGAGMRGGREFAEAFAASLQAASAAIPDIDVGADSSEADRKLSELKGRLEALGSKQIGVDINATDAYVQLGLLSAELEKVGRAHPDVNVKADVVDALVALEAIKVKAEEIDREDVDITVRADTGRAVAGLSGVGFAAQSSTMLVAGLAAGIIALGPAAVAAGNAAMGALAGIGAAATSALAGIGAAGLALVPVASRVSKLRQARQSVSGGVGGGGGGAAHAGAVQSASKQAEAARKTEEKSARAQVKRVEAEQKAVARASESGEKRVATAQARASAAREQAARSAEQAAARIVSAEKSLARAQEQVRKAQENLSQARREAVQDLKDLERQIKQGALAERSAKLSLEQAKKRLEDLGKTGGSSLDWQEARLALDQALQSVDDQVEANRRLAEEKTRGDASGVEGTRRVIAAQEQLQAAQDRVLDAQDQVVQARNAAAQAAEESAKRIAKADQSVADAQAEAHEELVEAQNRLAEAREAQSEAAQEAAQRVAEAEQAVVEAAKGSAQASQSAGLAGVGAADQVAQALEDLPESGRAFALYLDGLIDRAKVLSVTAMGGFLPGLQRGLQDAERHLPGVNNLISDLATRMGDMAEQSLKALSNPFWTGFGDYLSRTMGPNLTKTGKILGNFVQGLAGLVKATEPLQEYFLGAMERLSEKFHDWAMNLDSNRTFQDWMNQVIATAPQVGALLGAVTDAVANLLRGLGGDSGSANDSMRRITGFFQKIADADPQKVYQVAQGLGTLAASVAGLAATATVANALGSVYSALSKVGSLLRAGSAAGAGGGEGGLVGKVASLGRGFGNLGPKLASVAGPALKFMGVAGLVSGAIMELWTNNEGFRDTVTNAWEGIKDAISQVWNEFLQPVFETFGELIQTVAGLFQDTLGPIVNAVWNGILQPVIRELGAIVKVVFETIIMPLLKLLAGAFEAMAKSLKWVSENIIAPVFHAVGDVLKAVFERTVKPVFDLFTAMWKTLGEGVQKVYTGTIKPAWDAMTNFLQNTFKTAWKTAVDSATSIWNGLKRAVASPVNFVIDTIWNNGIAAGFNSVASKMGVGARLGRISRVAFASGGIMPGYTPGRDVHHFYSPSAGFLDLSGGEGIIRPDVLRALGGKKWLDFVNREFRNGRKPVGDLGAVGDPRAPGIPRQSFAKGGIFSAIGNFIENFWGDPMSTLVKTLFAPARALMRKLAGNSAIAGIISGVPGLLFDGIGSLFKREVNASGGSKGQRLVSWLRTNVVAKRVPYVWGGANVPPGLDCSGMVSYGLRKSVAPGHPRLTSQAFDKASKPILKSELRVGDLLFNGKAGASPHVAVYSGNGKLIEEPAPGLHAREIGNWMPRAGRYKYDSGGVLPPGVTQAINLTGRPEAVLTNTQWAQLRNLADTKNTAMPAPQVSVTNWFPQAEPQSKTINDGLQVLTLNRFVGSAA